MLHKHDLYGPCLQKLVNHYGGLYYGVRGPVFFSEYVAVARQNIG